MPVKDGDTTVGRATSITWSPAVGSMIGFGIVEADSTEPGTVLSIDFPARKSVGSVAATVVPLPFLAHKRAD